jgi:hypothetical protein
MNVYVCSTVRHVLLSLCRATQEQLDQHSILFFADYQRTSLDAWSLGELPTNIHVYELSRGDLKRSLQSSLAGRFAYQCAMRMLPAPVWLQQAAVDALKEQAPELVRSLSDILVFKLWLFNERNRMSRVFRLLAKDFAIIEDGESNYLKFPVSPWNIFARLARLLDGLPVGYRTFGDDPRCKEIWVNYPERLPKLIQNKGRQINFLEGSAVAATISSIMGDQVLPPITARSVILATQPLDGMAKIPVAAKQFIYETVTTCLHNQGRDVILKLHPAENRLDYEFLHERTLPAPAKVPVEALILAASKPPIVLSISSAAGLGFERYCKRIKLIEYSDTDTVRKWVNNPAELTTLLEKALAENPSVD